MSQVSAKFLIEILLALSTKLGDGSTYDTLLHGKALLVIAAGDADDLFRTNCQYSSTRPNNHIKR